MIHVHMWMFIYNMHKMKTLKTGPHPVPPSTLLLLKAHEAIAIILTNLLTLNLDSDSMG